MSGKSKDAVATECAEMGWGQFKPLLTEVMVEGLRPLQERYTHWMSNQQDLEAVLKQGREQASAIAADTLAKVKAALGYSRPL